MTSSPTFFTVEADFRAVLEDISSDSDYDPQIAPISGTVTFTPILNSGDVILATDADPRPIGFLPTPVVGKIDPADGRLKLRTETDLGGEGEFAPVRLLADTDLLELSTPLYYRVEFSSIRLGSRVGKITGFSFRAPTSDTTVNLIEVGRAPGLAASGTYHIAPAAVRVVNDEMVFSFGGVDIPDPVPLVDLTGPAVAAQAASEIHAAAEKANPVDADEVPLLDSAASFGWKRWSWANIKAALGAWYDTATRTLTNKTLTTPTLTDPRSTNLRDPSTSSVWASHSYETVYLNPGGRSSFQASADANAVNIVRVTGQPAGYPPLISATGTDTNVSLNLVPKNAGVVQANGVPVVTTSGTATLTNKTISGASNTITNLPASATPDAARLVRSHGSSAGNWYKVFSFNPGAVPYARHAAMYAVGGYSNGSAIIAVSVGNGAEGTISCSVEFIAKGDTYILNDDAFKIVSDGYGSPIELWVQTVNSSGSAVTYYELSRYNIVNPALTYDTSNVATSTEPVGSVLNVRSAGLVANGVPVVTTSGTATLTNKTLSSPTINSPRIDSIKDTNGNSIVALAPVANAVNYFTIANAAAGSIPSISTTGTMRFSAGGAGYLEARNGNGVIFKAKADQASTVNNLSFLASASGTDVEIRGEGSDTNVGVIIRPQGAGTLKVGSNPVGVKVAVPATATSTGALGNWAADTDYIYVCTATDTWRRAALSTW